MAARARPWRVPDRLWAEVEPLIPKVERRFREWQRAGVWARLLERMQELLEEEGLADWSRAIVDASLVDAKKGAARSAARSEAALEAVSI
jgi:transposase